MPPSLSLITLNVERGKHLGLVLPFLERERPDVCCIQELREPDIPRFEEALGAPCVYEPLVYHDLEDEGTMNGIGIFSRHPMASSGTKYIFGEGRSPVRYENGKQETFNRAVLYADVEKEDTTFRVGTVHFTWSPDGKPNDEQRRDLTKLMGIIDELDELVLVGDFNAPRGGEIFSKLATRMKDNVPPIYESSIDPDLHRKKGLIHMVDGIFSTPAYAVSDVRMVCALSDHCSLSGTITRTNNK